MFTALGAVAKCATNCAHQIGPGLTDVQALSTLLTTESLLFTVVSLALSFASSGTRPRRFLLPPNLIIGSAVLLISGLATAAGFAWVKIFWRDFPSDVPSQVVAILLAAAIVVEPVLALLLASGIRTEK